jgi:hypothetical protein
MNKPVLYRMVEELRQQSRFAQLAFQTLRVRVNEGDPERVFLEVHALLGHLVMLSRLLWPARPSSLERGTTLQAEMKIAPENPLRLAGARDQVERLDEAYEDWLLGLPEAGYVDMNLMPTGTMMGSRADTFQRSLDPDTLVLHLRGVPIDLKRTNDAARALETGAQQWLRTHTPW